MTLYNNSSFGFLLLALSCLLNIVPIAQGKKVSMRANLVMPKTLTHALAHTQQFLGGKRPAVGSDALQDFIGLLLAENVTVAKPEQKFSVMIDTTMAEFWLIDKDSNAAKDHSDRTFYDVSASTTATANGRKFNITTMDLDPRAYVTGPLVNETVTFAGLTVTSEMGRGVEVEDFLGLGLININIDGVLGLAWSSRSKTNVKNPFIRMAESGQLDDQMFTIYINPSGDYQVENVESRITFGGRDTQNCAEDRVSVPLSSKSYWQFQLTNVGFGKQSVKKNRQAVLATLYGFALGPEDDVKLIAKGLGAKFYDEGYYTLPCEAENLPDISFQISGFYLNISSSVYLTGYSSGFGDCLFGIFPLPKSSAFNADWFIGNGFLSQFCVEFDYGNARLGFSQSIPK